MKEFKDKMLKEINEQPEVLARILDSQIRVPEELIRDCKKIYIVASGTSYHAGLSGKIILERFLRIPVETDLASEFYLRQPLIDEETLVIFISQSGQTADTLSSLRYANKMGARTLALVNVIDSTIANEADFALDILAGEEVAIASTKAYTATLLVLYLLAIDFAQIVASSQADEAKKLKNDILQLPLYAEKILLEQEASFYHVMAEGFKEKSDIFYLGKGLDWATAREGVLKIKEISYIHAEAFASGEMKHGTMALITGESQILAVNTQEALSERTLSIVDELKKMGARAAIIAQEGSKESAEKGDQLLFIPKMPDLLTPIISIIPLQLLAYYTALAKGNDVDSPRNLTKAVTSE